MPVRRSSRRTTFPFRKATNDVDLLVGLDGVEKHVLADGLVVRVQETQEEGVGKPPKRKGIVYDIHARDFILSRVVEHHHGDGFGLGRDGESRIGAVRGLSGELRSCRAATLAELTIERRSLLATETRKGRGGAEIAGGYGKHERSDDQKGEYGPSVHGNLRHSLLGVETRHNR